MSCKGSVRLAAPLSMVALGIPKMTELASSWAITTPPSALTVLAPAAPSLPMPVRTPARVDGPYVLAALSKRQLAEGRKPKTGGALLSVDRKSVGWGKGESVRVDSGGGRNIKK